MQKTVGILGGMGPEATALFYHKVVQLSPAKNDQDHLKTIILSNPKIPDRNSYFANKSQSPLPTLIDSVKQLECMGADFISMPCNTVHGFWKQLCEAVNIPILNIISETVAAIKNDRQEFSNSHIGLLATDGTLRMEIYQQPLLSAGFKLITPEPAAQKAVHDGIYSIKSGENTRKAIENIQKGILSLQQQEASALIYGCTEFNLIKNELRTEITPFDSLDILAKATVDFALSK